MTTRSAAVDAEQQALIDERANAVLDRMTPALISLPDEILMAAQSVMGLQARYDRVMSVIERRASEATLTLVLTHNVDYVVNVLNDALLGQRYDEEGRPSIVVPPVKPLIRLESRLMRCPQCEGNKCGRKGKRHDIVYKTGTKSGTGAEHRQIEHAGGSSIKYIRCVVDPETGLFDLTPAEAKKCLRQFGEPIARPRWQNTIGKTGDKWIVREVDHFAHYRVSTDDAAKDVAPLTLI